MIATAKRAPDGLFSTVVAVRTKNPTDRIVTFDGFAVTGVVHQVALPFFGSPYVTPVGFPQPPWDALRDVWPDWSPADTQLLIPFSRVGGGFGSAHGGITEENDSSDPAALADVLLPFESFGRQVTAITGFGTLEMYSVTDAFYLRQEFQTNYVELVQIVTVARHPDDGEPGQAFLQIGIQGGDQDNMPLPSSGHGIIGFEEPLAIPFFAEPCDLDADGRCDQSDADLLLASLGTENPDFNLDGSDPPIITQLDHDQWRRYIEPIAGDTDYDGDVDAVDLNELAINWHRSSLVLPPGWEGGDFNGDGSVTASDLNALALNWEVGVDAAATSTVPEPSVTALLVWMLVTVTRFRHSRHRHYRSSSGEGGM